MNISRVILIMLILPSLLQAQTLKFSTIAMQGSYQIQAFEKARQEILDRTGIIIKVYTGGAMGTGDTLFRKIKLRQLDGGSFTASEAAQYCPDLHAPSMALMFDSYAEVDRVLPQLAPGLERQLAEAGYVVLAWVETGFSYLMSTQTISNADEIRQRSVWVPADDWIGPLEFKEFGINTKPMSISQATTGLMTGMVDTVAGPFIAAVGLQWFTKVRYVLDVPLLYSYSVILVAQDRWRQIAPADQKFIKEVFDSHFEILKERTRAENREARQVLLERGIVFQQPSASDLADLELRMQRAHAKIEARGLMNTETLRRLAELTGGEQP